MSVKTINISLRADLLKIIDEAAKANYCTRSDYIREAVQRRIEAQRDKELRHTKRGT